MLTRLREGTPDAAPEGRASPGTADPAGAPVRIEALGHSFGELRAIERLDLEVEPGEVVGIVGPSGCGKTTLLELVAGLRSADSGRVSVGGATDPAERLERCAYMPQRDLLLPWLSALDNAGLALRIAGDSRQEARKRAAAHFQRLGLAGFEHARPGELSGGMPGAPFCCSTSRSPRSTRSPAPRCSPGLPGCSAPTGTRCFW
jgi:NitT/TauT family transport system ATP-binding protein